MIAKGALLALAAAVLSAASLACGSGDEQAAAALTERLEAEGAELAAVLEVGHAEPADLVVRLAFGADADLDLYVTDPLLETVYFANREPRSGGRIEADLRCDAPAPRVEEVRFEEALPGPYRVGVDHPTRCDDGAEPVAYALSVEGRGVEHSVQGSVGLREFRVVALEFEIAARGDR